MLSAEEKPISRSESCSWLYLAAHLSQPLLSQNAPKSDLFQSNICNSRCFHRTRIVEMNHTEATSMKRGWM